MTESVSFTVAGVARPQGSMRAFVRGDKVVITSATKGLDEWRDAIAWEARAVTSQMLVGPLRLAATFTLPRPKSDFLADGSVRPSARLRHDKRPDLDKLTRALMDALTGVAYADDSQVAAIDVAKVYVQHITEQPQVDVFVMQEAR